jgi:hypothetical protein
VSPTAWFEVRRSGSGEHQTAARLGDGPSELVGGFDPLGHDDFEVAEAPELPGCVADGKTHGEVLGIPADVLIRPTKHDAAA